MKFETIYFVPSKEQFSAPYFQALVGIAVSLFLIGVGYDLVKGNLKFWKYEKRRENKQMAANFDLNNFIRHEFNKLRWDLVGNNSST